MSEMSDLVTCDLSLVLTFLNPKELQTTEPNSQTQPILLTISRSLPNELYRQPLTQWLGMLRRNISHEPIDSFPYPIYNPRKSFS